MASKPPSKPNQPGSEYAAWLAEEAERINALGEQARKMGIVIPTGVGTPPALNPDGSLAKPKK